jgi:ElaB/YqjD/DUF883 family membrane-anchored ribosome-binding protein
MLDPVARRGLSWIKGRARDGRPLICVNPRAAPPAQSVPTSSTGSIDMSDLTDAVRAKLAQDVRAMITDVEDLLRLKAADAGEQANGLRDRLQERVRSLKAQVQAVEADAAHRARDAMDAADRQVRLHPWGAAGLAAAAGLLVGLLLRRD